MPLTRPRSDIPIVLGLPLVFTTGLAAFALLDSVRQNTSLSRAFLGAAAVLLVRTAVLLTSALRARRSLTLTIVLRKQHYVQALAQGSVLVYWG